MFAGRPLFMFAGSSHFCCNSSVPSICFCRMMSASSALVGASVRQVVSLPSTPDSTSMPDLTSDDGSSDGQKSDPQRCGTASDTSSDGQEGVCEFTIEMPRLIQLLSQSEARDSVHAFSGLRKGFLCSKPKKPNNEDQNKPKSSAPRANLDDDDMEFCRAMALAHAGRKGLVQNVKDCFGNVTEDGMLTVLGDVSTAWDVYAEKRGIDLFAPFSTYEAKYVDWLRTQVDHDFFPLPSPSGQSGASSSPAGPVVSSVRTCTSTGTSQKASNGNTKKKKSRVNRGP